MASGTILSRVLGLLRDIITTAVFDRTVTDAWLVAFRLPNLFRRMLGEGSFSISFIPVFVTTLNSDGDWQQNQRARALLNGIFTLLTATLLSLTTAGILGAESILAWLVPGQGYLSVPGKFQLTVQMAQIMFGFIFFISLFAYFMAILNSFKYFAAAALAPALFNLVLILSALFPQKMRFEGETLAWAVLLGGFAQMAVLVPALQRIHALPKWTLNIWNPDIKEVLLTLIPSWVGVGILQLTALINVRLGSELGEGTHSWIYLADRILELPLSLFAVSVGSALLPTLSLLWAQNKKEEMVATSQKFLLLTFFLSMPAAVGLFVLADPIVRALFQHGRFSETDVLMTASLIRIYSAAILSYGGIRVLVSPFYATRNARLPAMVSGLCLLFHYFLASAWIHIYGVSGITASSVVSSLVNCTLLLILHWFYIGPWNLRSLLKGLALQFLAASIMGLTLTLYWPLQEALNSLSFIGDISVQISLTCLIITGALEYFFLAHLMGMDEMKVIWPRIQSKFRRFIPIG